MDTKKVAYFLEVVKLKSIAKASKSLGVEQSILNRAVRSLEEDLKTELYIHYDKTFKLTKQGKIAYKYFRKLVSVCSDLEECLTDAGEKERIDLHILSSNGMANFFLISNLSPFLEENKNIFLSFSTNDLVQILDVGVDICIGPKIEGEGIVNFYLFSYYLKMFASREYLKKMGHPQTAEDLEDHHLIAYSKHDISTFMDFDWHLRHGSPNGIQRKPYLQVSSSYALKMAAEQHLGIITFSKFLIERDSAPLIDIFPQEKGLKVDIYFSYRSNNHNERSILLYRDFLFKYFRSLPFHDD